MKRLFAAIFVFHFGVLIASASTLSLMTYNVENLFDTLDDEGKSDETYLPFKDKQNLAHVKKCMKVKNVSWAYDCYYLNWDAAQYGLKLKRLAEVIDGSEAKKNLDVLVLQEVENLRVLEDLNRILKKPFPYIIHQESSDKRGIDVAMLSRLKPDDETKLYKIPFKSAKKNLREDSREILYVRLNGDGFKVSVFGVHLPAPFHSWRYRADALEFINSLSKKLVPKSQLALVAGDFNIPSDELSKRSYNQKYWKNKWLVSHLEGCKQCKGSYYWNSGKSWSFLDVILVKAPEGERWSYNSESVELVTEISEQLKGDKPWGWSASGFKEGGVSDHLPLRLTVDAIK
ncbi:endonuclease/exonuclease/phosphatase family protein [bacterium]|nr:endonuclease/exonuclease/phosphatase family protein [bacterium]